MSEVVRWFLAGVAIMLVVFLIVVARGTTTTAATTSGRSGSPRSVARA